MNKSTQTHYLRYDSHRSVGLDLIINGLNDAVGLLYNKTLEGSYYDGVWFAEESEPIIGLAFIAFQNYINGSIYDFTGDNDIDKRPYYKIEQNSINAKRSRIELIIGLANYAKHKDEEKLRNGTKGILEDFGLMKKDKPSKYLILQGLNLLDENSDLIEVKELVKDWREYLWVREE